MKNMIKLCRVSINLCIVTMMATAVSSQSGGPQAIPRDLVRVDVSNPASTGSRLHLDFSPYWEVSSEVDGGEILSLWIALPDRGQPSVNILGSNDLPETCVELGRPAILRSVRIAPLFVRPVWWDGQQWVKITHLDLQITSSGTGLNQVEFPRRSRAFDTTLKSLLVNPPASTSADEFDQEHLLVVCPDFAENEVLPFVEWKRRKGIECTLSTLNDIGISADDAAGLKAYIQEAYDTWSNPPDFVLLAGDETVLPTRYDYTSDPTTIFSTASVPGFYADENYFACLEGDDYFPDIILGRWVANTEYEYTYLTAKLTRYEMNPNLYETEWYQRAAVASQDSNSYNGSPSMRETKLGCRQTMLDYGFAQVDTLFEPNNPYQFIQWINDGCGFVNYRGAGWSIGWSSINVYIYDIYNLQNSFKLPVVTGIGCGVGRFTDPDGTCFGEVFMLVGSLYDQRGCISFVGPGHNTHTVFNDTLDLGIYSSIFEDGESRIGAALIAGKMTMYDAFDDYFTTDPNVEEIVRVAFNQFYVLSDPELRPYTDVPRQFQVDFPGSILLGSQPVSVTVFDDQGSPYEGAQVCLYLPGDFMAADQTGPAGSVTLISNASVIPAYVYVTVTAPNYAASLDSILVITNSQYVVHHNVQIDDDLAGNGDGGFSPGEEADWIETLKNWGIALSPDVHATLSSSHASVTITQDSAGFGDIAAGDSAVGVPDYQLSIAAQPYTIGDELQFQIDIVDGMDSSWTSYLSFPLLTPDLEVLSLNPDPSGNDRLDRGETCNMSFVISNVGLIEASDGLLELHCDDPYMDIIEGSVSCGALGINQVFTSGSNPFVVSVSPYAPTMHEVEFNIRLVSNELTYNFADSALFSFPIGEYAPDDPTSDSLGTYYGYESWDTLYTEVPTFEWFEIDSAAGGPGGPLPFSPEVQTVILDLPFTFRYWGQDFNRLTVCADGWVMPGETSATLPDNSGLPCVDEVPGMIAGLWDNLWHPTQETGRISYYYDSTNDHFYVEYYEVSHQVNPIPKETFQIVLCDPSVVPTATGDGEILFYYLSLHLYGQNFSTAGIESPDQSNGVEFCYNNNYPVTSHGLSDSLAIRWTTDEPLITAIPAPSDPKAAQFPPTFTLYEPYPNPFNARAVLSFSIPTTGQVTLEVYNLRGQRVADLYRGTLGAGSHRLDFDASDLGSGIYFARLKVQNYTTVRKLLLIK